SNTNGMTGITADGFAIGVAEDRNKRCRRTMEDAHSYITDYIGVPRQGFFAIFDGHAGKATAEWCGANFHNTLAECLKIHEQKPVPEVLNLAFLEVDRQVNLNEGKSSGCTAVVAFVQAKDDKRILYTGNVGDARAVLCRKGKAVRLSYDHKGSDHQEAKRITDLGGFMMNNRVNGVLAVTRSLGDCVMKEFVVGNPYTTETELGQGDDFLILACDGLWDVCEDQDAVDLVKDIQDPQVASRKLLDHALANFSTDNLSILVIR
ncbi:phosphatase 2C-like domain-containing protein, partial [Phascolomyces articulosus]